MLDGFMMLLEIAHELAQLGLQLAIAAGASAAVLVVLVVVINVAARRWLTAAQMGFLWALVLLRLAMPIAPSSQISLQNLYANVGETNEAEPRDMYSPDSQFQAEVLAMANDPDAEVHAVVPAPVPEFSLLDELLDELLVWAPLAWLAGAVFVLVSNLFVHWRFSRRVAQAPVCQDERLLGRWQQCREQVGIRREIPIVLCDEVAQPAVMGAVWPKLLLPEHCLELRDDQLRMVMLHELMHVRRYDISVNWLLVLVRAVQWWNPVFWLASSRYFNLREQSRDAMVLRCLQGEGNSVRTYSELLLTLAERGSQRAWRVLVPASMLGFISGWFRSRGISNRLKSLPSAASSQRRWHRQGIVGLLLVLGLAGLTDAMPEDRDEGPTYSDTWRQLTGGAETLVVVPEGVPPQILASFGDELSGPWAIRVYDVTAGVEVIRQQQQCTLEKVQELLSWELNFLADPAQMSTGATREDAVAAELAEKPSAELVRQEDAWVVLARGPADVQRRMERAVHAWNRSGLGQVTIETRIATSPHNVLDQAGIAWDDIITSPLQRNQNAEVSANANPMEPREENSSNKPSVSAVASVEEHVPMMLKVLSPAELKRFMQFHQTETRSNMLVAPKVTLLNGQRASISSSTQRPFVTGLKQTGSSQPDEGFKPQIDIVEEGFNLSLGVELAPQHNATDIVAGFDLIGIQDVQVFSTKLSGQETTVQVPRVSHLRLNTTVRLLDHHTLLCCIPPTYDRKEYSWVLLTPRVLKDEE